jgi:hypothetical protein
VFESQYNDWHCLFYLSGCLINPDHLSSGFHREGTTEELLELGAKGFIKKPYNMVDLSRAVAEYVST